MKVRISYHVEVDDDYRRAVNRWYGRPGKATHAELHDWFKANGQSMDDDIAQMIEDER